MENLLKLRNSIYENKFLETKNLVPIVLDEIITCYDEQKIIFFVKLLALADKSEEVVHAVKVLDLIVFPLKVAVKFVSHECN